MTEIEERVRRGAELLDERRPGWAPEIDAQRLNLFSCKRCVLGQLYGSYQKGKDILVFDGVDAREHGFTLYGSDEEEGDFDDLAAAWLAEIARRVETEGRPT